MLARSHSIVHGVGDVYIPKHALPVLALDAEPLGFNTPFVTFFFLFPGYRPLLAGPESHFYPPNEKVSEVLSVQESLRL